MPCEVSPKRSRCRRLRRLRFNLVIRGFIVDIPQSRFLERSAHVGHVQSEMDASLRRFSSSLAVREAEASAMLAPLRRERQPRVVIADDGVADLPSRHR
jgi:hypothetical protein